MIVVAEAGPHRLAGLACGIGAGALWGGVFLAPALLPDFTALQLAAGRYLVYGAVSLLAAPGLRQRLRGRLDGDDWSLLVRLGLLGNIAYYVCLARGIALAGIAPAALIVGLLPITIALAGRREDGIALRRLALPLLLVGGGIVLLNLPALWGGSGRVDAGRVWGGLGCDVGALVCWTLYAVGNARALKRRPHVSGADWSLLTGLVTGLLALGLAVPAFAGGGVQAASRWTLFWTLSGMVAIGASVVGNALWNMATRRLPVGLGGMLVTAETLFALLYGFLQAGRLPAPVELAAMVALVGGVVGAGLAFSRAGRDLH